MGIKASAMNEPVQLSKEDVAAARSFRTRLSDELSEFAQGYWLLLVFALGGILVVSLFLPGHSLTARVVGGIALGCWSALCAIPEKFLGD